MLLLVCVVFRFMLILASNQPDQFDWAINDRLDDLVPFSLPGSEERYRLLKQYFAEVCVCVYVFKTPTIYLQYVISPPRTSWWRRQKMIPIPSDVDWEKYFKTMADEVKGFSGREIAKLAIAWQVKVHPFYYLI